MADRVLQRDTLWESRTRLETHSCATGGQAGWELSLLLDFTSGCGAGSFKVSGASENAGTASYRFSVAASSIEGVLELEGTAGRLRLRASCTATFSSALAADIEGAVVIVDGDGAHAGLDGGGRLVGRMVYDTSKQGFLLSATCRISTRRKVAAANR